MPGSEWSTPKPSSRSCSTPTGEPWGRSIIPSRSSATSTPLARWSGSEASGRVLHSPDGGSNDRDPLILQVKEAQESVLERFLGKSQYSHHGQRVVAGQRLMQAAGDIFLGWQQIKGFDGVTRDYYVRQLHDWKGSVEVDRIRVAERPSTPASAGHPGPGPRPVGGPDRDQRHIWATATTSTGPSSDFSVTYADQNERDYEAFVDAVASGRFTARPGCRRGCPPESRHALTPRRPRWVASRLIRAKKGIGHGSLPSQMSVFYLHDSYCIDSYLDLLGTPNAVVTHQGAWYAADN